MWMSVLMVPIGVLRTVSILMVLTTVAVELVMFSMLMGVAVMVRLHGLVATTNHTHSLSCHSDADECTLGTHMCAQTCSNTVGSYTCHCGSGYRLNTDRRGCDGEYLWREGPDLEVDHGNGSPCPIFSIWQMSTLTVLGLLVLSTPWHFRIVWA